MNLWRRGPLTENPYWRTAFRVARVPRETIRHRTIVQLISQTRKVVSADPQAHVIQGVPVTLAEINKAETILLNPGQRILEELLEHATERLPLERIRRLAAEASEALHTEEAFSPTLNADHLRSWLEALVRQFGDSLPEAEPSFGALELEVTPPFGRPGDD